MDNIHTEQFENLKTKLLNKLIEVVPIKVEKLKIEKRISFISLFIDKTNTEFPMIRIALEGSAEVHKWHSNTYQAIYSPLVDKSLTKLFKQFVALSENNFEDTVKLLSELTQELNTHQWNTIAHTNEDFIIFVEWEGFKPSFDFYNSVPHYRVKILKEKGYLL